MADMIDSGKISFACELDKDLETPTTESNTEARITFTETQIVLGLGNDKSIKYKATGQGTDLSNYYNRSEVDEKLKLKADKTQLGDYYNKGEVDSSLGNKVDTTTLTTDYYNKTETDNLLRNKADNTVLENYYNKSDIDGKLTNKVDTTTLDNYDLSTEVDNKVKVVSDKVGDLSTLETGVKDTVVAAINEVKRAQTEAGKVTNLNDLGDVNASAPRRGQFLGWDQDTRKWVSKDVETDGMDTHMADFNNPHRTTISNLNDTTIRTPKANQVLVYNGTKWINKDVSLDDSNYAKKNEANIFTKKQSGIDGTEDANFVTLKQLKTKVGLTGNETIRGNKTFSSPIIIPNATANNHSLPLGQADGRYGQLLTQNLEWSVGTGGDFTNLQDALNKASSYTPIRNYFITIMLKSGYNGSLSVSLNNVNLGFVKIDAEADLKNMQFYFDFRNVICPKFNNKIKVKLNAYSSAIYIEDEITLDTGTALEGCTLVILNTLNILCKGPAEYNQDILFMRCQFRIKNLNITFSGIESSQRHNGLVLWNSIGRIETINFENNINRTFTIIWNVGSNTDIMNLNGTISDQVSVPACEIIKQDRGGFVAITSSVNITGGSNNITVFKIYSGSILIKDEISILLGNCTKSNIASNILSASGGFINR
ncbi:hypothetical protein FW707_06255 [Campylobacter coli]|nr:hypothetical protein [Campylobacter coli]